MGKKQYNTPQLFGGKTLIIILHLRFNVNTPVCAAIKSPGGGYSVIDSLFYRVSILFHNIIQGTFCCFFLINYSTVPKMRTSI